MRQAAFFFRDGHEDLVPFINKFYPLAFLLKRLLEEKYQDKKLNFIAISFYTPETFRNGVPESGYGLNWAGDAISYDEVFDRHSFEQMSENEMKYFLWNKAFAALKMAAEKKGNKLFLEAAEYAHKKGIDNGLALDYKAVDTDIILYEKAVKATLWIRFKEEWSSELKLEREGKVFFTKGIHKIPPGNGFFIIAYKKLEADKKNRVVIKGAKDLKLPMTIEIPKDLLV
jgi:hypothetical protein